MSIQQCTRGPLSDSSPKTLIFPLLALWRKSKYLNVNQRQIVQSGHISIPLFLYVFKFCSKSSETNDVELSAGRKAEAER